jgi:hypothetical protein
VRDKTYGIIGLLDPSISEHIGPDYRISVRGNSAAFAKAVYAGTMGFSNLIDMKVTSPNLYEAPSWVLDLNAPPGAHFPSRKEKPPYSECSSSLPDIQFTENDLLVSKGFQIDVIDGLAAAQLNDNSEVIQSVHNRNAYGSDIRIRRVLWRTLVAERDGSDDFASYEFERILDIPWGMFDPSENDMPLLYITFEDFRTKNKTFKICGLEFYTYFASANGTMPRLSVKQRKKFIERVTSMMTRRRLMTTIKGYLGIAPKSARQGDVICILLGCEFPVVLRPLADRDSFDLVGGCFVTGLMEGEAIAWLWKVECQLQSFKIC